MADQKTIAGRQGPLSIFRSARIKLTVFYFAVILVFCLALTISIRLLAEHEFSDAGESQRGEIRSLLYNLYSVPPQPFNTFNRFQNGEDASVRHNLNRDVMLVDLVAIIAGGFLSYWYAGRALKPIEDAHETQARFAADASHELRTPLTNLKLENEVFLRQKKFSDADARQQIASNLEEVGRLENLAGNLLALTQYENANLELNAIDARSLINKAVDNFRKPLKSKKISVVQDVKDQKVLGNSESLLQLIGIVLDNAIKYSPSGKKVYIDGVETSGDYHISIRDEGPGIEEADLPYIFDRLYRGDKSRGQKTEGYGLGLALAKEIAKANNAEITGRNYPVGGAQFVISLQTT